MYNQVTDHYQFVEVKVITAPPVLGRMISSAEGYSLQLFRSKEYVRSLRPHNLQSGPVSRTRPRSVQKPEQMRVYNGDVIYKIDMRSHSIPIVGSFKTKDNYVPIYDIALDLVVNDPVLFAKGYSLGRDPVHLAIEHFKTAFLGYAAKTEHDKLNVLRPPEIAWNDGLSNDTGMMIHQISQWRLREDPKRLETAEIEQDAVKNTLLVMAKAETKKLELMYQLHSQLSNTAAQELKAILQERIRDAFESGKPVGEVAEETLELLNALFKGIEDFTFSNGTSIAMNGASPGAGGTGTDTRGTPSDGGGYNRGTSSTPPGVDGTSADMRGTPSGGGGSGGASSTTPSSSGTVPGMMGRSFEADTIIGEKQGDAATTRPRYHAPRTTTLHRQARREAGKKRNTRPSPQAHQSRRTRGDGGEI